MGGGVAIMVAAACPERVQAVISIDSVGVMTKSPKDAVGACLHVLQTRFLGLKQIDFHMVLCRRLPACFPQGELVRSSTCPVVVFPCFHRRACSGR
jgi:pimeloyl-ACP methyl ester carboxylesterase